MLARTLLAAVVVLAFGPSVASASTILDSAIYNGHTYYLIGSDAGGAITQTDAEAAAVGLGGHLATINDQAENSFIWQTFSVSQYGFPNLWIGLVNNNTWLSGEVSTYRNWFPSGEPAGEDSTAILTGGRGDSFGTWFDVPGAQPNSFGFATLGVAEVVPEPTSLGVLALGGLAAALRRRKARRA